MPRRSTQAAAFRNRPLIGVTPDFEDAPKGGTARYHLKVSYTEAIAAAGGVPMVLPYTTDKATIAAYLRNLDGLVLTGGAFDIPPSDYGARRRPYCGPAKPQRTRFERATLDAALERDMPVLGICGGMQLLNVAFGGTLFQDLSHELPRATGHEQKTPRHRPAHTVVVGRNTLLASAVGEGKLSVNSTHHQAIRDVGRGLRVSAIAPDGVIEAVESESHRFALGVQWHPELLLKTVGSDEIDAVGRHRGAGLGGGHDEREQTLNQLLVEMDGFEANEGVILVAATNRPDVLDPALLRPGRFDRRIVVPRPDVKGRLGILQVHTKRTPLANEVDLETIARGTPGFSGADIENLVNEAALLAARKNKERVDMGEFESAKDKVLMGVERRSMYISEKEKWNTAVHEAGHTLVAKMLADTDPVHKVTIIPRGPALGLMQQLPSEDRYNASRDYAKKRIAIALGGRIAEELTFNEMTSGASNDIEQATDMARRMVCEWGMSDKLGPLSFGKKEESVFLGREISRTQDYSPETAIAIDAEVKAIVMAEYDRAKQILSDNKDKLERISKALIEYETLDGEEISLLMDGKELPRPKPEVKANTHQPRPQKQEKEKEKKKILEALEGLRPNVTEPGAT